MAGTPDREGTRKKRSRGVVKLQSRERAASGDEKGSGQLRRILEFLYFWFSNAIYTPKKTQKARPKQRRGQPKQNTPKLIFIYDRTHTAGPDQATSTNRRNTHELTKNHAELKIATKHLRLCNLAFILANYPSWFGSPGPALPYECGHK